MENCSEVEADESENQGPSDREKVRISSVHFSGITMHFQVDFTYRPLVD